MLESTKDGIIGETIRYKLHFFWIVDNSYSMSGPKIQTVNKAIRDALPEIAAVVAHNVEVSMRGIRFGSDAEWHTDSQPVSLSDFNWKDLDGNGGYTSTSRALHLLCDELAVEKLGKKCVVPVAILLSDGFCTDSDQEYADAIERLNQSSWGKRAVRLSIGIGTAGEDYDKEQLDQFITPYLRQENGLETLEARSASQLADFINNASVAVSSVVSNAENMDSPAPVSLAPSGLHNSTDPLKETDYDDEF